jgi:hypothetical protein
MHELMHEMGHHLQNELESPELQRALAAQSGDVSHLSQFRSCMDENIAQGEFGLFRVAGRPTTTQDRSAAILKRTEYLADFMGKAWLEHKADALPNPSDQRSALIYRLGSVYCDFLGYDAVVGKADPTHLSASEGDSHADERYRVPQLIHGLLPLAGDSLGVAEPRSCQYSLWPYQPTGI